MKSFKVLILCCCVLCFFISSTVHAQWKQTNGLYTNTVGYGYSPITAIDSTLFSAFRVDGGGEKLFRSTDNGLTWLGTTNYSSTNTTVSSNDDFRENELLVAIGATLFAIHNDSVLVFSIDKGNSWKTVSISGRIITLAVSGSTLFTGGREGIFRVTQNGSTWISEPTSLKNIDFKTMTVISSTLFVRTGSDGVFRSTDYGNTWTTIPIGIYKTCSFLKACGTTLFSDQFFWRDGLPGGFRDHYVKRRSIDNGNTWTTINFPDTTVRFKSIVNCATSLFALTNNNEVYRSNDNGDTWTKLILKSGDTYINVANFHVVGTTIFAGSGGILYRSTDIGETWLASKRNIDISSLGVSGTSLFAFSWSNGAFRSTDAGENWTNNISGLSYDIYDIVVNRSTLFASYYYGVLRSTDNGKTWSILKSIEDSLEGSSINAIGNGTTIFASSDRATYSSTDNGESWVKIYKGLHSLTVSGTKLFGVAGGDSGDSIFRSIDYGATWSVISSGLVKCRIQTLAVTGTTIFAGTDIGVFRGTDVGMKWEMVNSGLNGKFVQLLIVNGKTLFAVSDSVSVYNSTYNASVYRSTDNGENWQVVNSGLKSKFVSTFAASGTMLFAGTDIGMFRSADDGLSWTEVNLGLNQHTVLSLAVKDSTIFVVTTNGGIYSSTNNGDTWIQVGLGWISTSVFGGYNNTLFKGSTALFLGLHGVYRSTDNGESWWTVGYSGLTESDVSSFVENGSFMYASTRKEQEGAREKGQGVYRSADKGLTWSASNSGLTNTDVTSLAIKGSTLFAGTVIGGIFKSLDNGGTWSAASNGLRNLNIWSLAVNGTSIFAGTYKDSTYPSGGVFRSVDDGENWTEVSSGMTDKEIWSLIANGNDLFVGTDSGGVFRSINNGESWSPVNTGLANKSIRSLAVSEGTLYAATHVAGVWKVNISALGIEQENEQKATIPHLTCYPNPATNTLTIDRTSLFFNSVRPIKYTITTLTGEKLMEFENEEPQISLPLVTLGNGVYCLAAQQGLARSATLFTVFQ
ncbi:MAG: hypothetical protein IPM69_13050 [Ignavibacteria bacterium]|nr:hypothetical protein [Ignavibacteria bacterium]